MKRTEPSRICYDVAVLSKREFVSCMGEVAGISCLVNLLCYRSIFFFLFAIPFVVWYFRWKKKTKAEKRRKRLEDQFGNVLRGLHTAVRAGYSMEQAVTECKKELLQMYGEKNDLVRELQFMEVQMRLGTAIEELFLDLGERSAVEDIRYFGEVFFICKRSGGNLARMMEKLAKVLGEKDRVRKEIDVTIAAKKLEQGIMSMVPGGMILYLQITSKGFLDVLYHNLFGVLVMSGCLLLYLFSFWLGKRIVRISI